jgi:hypothetical protein
MEDAFSHGTPVLTVGNVNDLLWEPGVCPLGSGDFRTTQWVEDLATSNVAVYGREFTSGSVNCLPTTFIDNHGAALSNADVELGITEFLINGGVPLPLAVAPSSL